MWRIFLKEKKVSLYILEGIVIRVSRQVTRFTCARVLVKRVCE